MPEPTETAAPTGHSPGAAPWWAQAVFYQVYIRSFADSDGDGVGDLEGIRTRLTYLGSLGVDALWITPFYPSPMADHGYDVADPRGVEPVFGTLAAFDRLVRDAHALDLKVTIDVVPNHTSYRHEWFQAALAAGPGSRERARYLFRDGRGPHGAEPPNNWPSTFGGPAWTRVPDGQWYLHLFAPEQPDLDWRNPEVQADLERTLRFWLDRGVDGFRFDVSHGLAKPVGLPDMDDPRNVDILQRSDRVDPRFDNDEVHEHWRAVRKVLDSYPGDRMAVGEAWVRDDERLARYVRRDELQLAFNFHLVQAKWDADDLRTAISDSITAMSQVDAVATWVLSNHDIPRHVTRYGGGRLGERRARAAALLQLALPGVAYIYQGDELGLAQVDVPDAALQDPVWERSGHTDRGRDGCRVPIPWSGTRPPYGFSADSAPTWLPMPDGWSDRTVDAEDGEPDSMLTLYRRALQLRHTHPALRTDAATGEDRLRWLDSEPGTLAFARPSGLVCVVNASADSVALPEGELLLSSAPLGADATLPADTAAWLVRQR